MKAYYRKYVFRFKRPAKTSRSIYERREVWYLFLEKEGKTGVGECAPLPGLSSETPAQVEQVLNEICENPENFIKRPELTKGVSSVRFALETAWHDLQNGGKQLLFSSLFSEGKAGIPVNGLIWMGEPGYMMQQIQEKVSDGFRCIKLKIGGIDFEEELKILKFIREKYHSKDLILRLDANGAFSSGSALQKLNQLKSFNIHSVEQPIAAGQWQEMAKLCKESPIPIALDEELIGINEVDEKEELLQTILPHYLVLKPGLHGGFYGCGQWTELAEKYSAGWWITSYLESNIGLNAIAQWTFHKAAAGFQGLGTGGLFTNNIPSPLELRGEELWINPERSFCFPENFFSR